MTADYYGTKAIDKIRKALNDYLTRKNARPEALAWDWANLPEDEQEGICETVFQYIQDLPNVEVHSHQMLIYQDIARRMKNAMLNSQ